MSPSKDEIEAAAKFIKATYDCGPEYITLTALRASEARNALWAKQYAEAKALISDPAPGFSGVSAILLRHAHEREALE